MRVKCKIPTAFFVKTLLIHIYCLLDLGALYSCIFILLEARCCPFGVIPGFKEEKVEHAFSCSLIAEQEMDEIPIRSAVAIILNSSIFEVGGFKTVALAFRQHGELSWQLL